MRPRRREPFFAFCLQIIQRFLPFSLHFWKQLPRHLPFFCRGKFYLRVFAHFRSDFLNFCENFHLFFFKNFDFFKKVNYICVFEKSRRLCISDSIRPVFCANATKTGAKFLQGKEAKRVWEGSDFLARKSLPSHTLPSSKNLLKGDFLPVFANAPACVNIILREVFEEGAGGTFSKKFLPHISIIPLSPTSLCRRCSRFRGGRPGSSATDPSQPLWGCCSRYTPKCGTASYR